MNGLPAWWKYDKPYAIADCLDVMRAMPDKCVDLVLTDPPYAVDYADWDVAPDGWFDECIRISKQVVFTPGIRNLRKHPTPKWIICWAKPGSTRRNDTGGFNHWEPLLYYGDKKIMVDFLYLPDCVNHSKSGGHPCPKPIALYEWVVEGTTGEGDIVFDPFLGSGTTLLACRKTGRIGLGVEINPSYEKLISDRSLEKISTIDQFFEA